jgi:hypothetical protein
MKELLIKDIQTILSEHGRFDIRYIQDDVSLCLASRGNLVSLVEDFMLDYCIVVTYNSDYSMVDSYTLSYLDMSTEELGRVLDICSLFQLQQPILD